MSSQQVVNDNNDNNMVVAESRLYEDVCWHECVASISYHTHRFTGEGCGVCETSRRVWHGTESLQDYFLMTQEVFIVVVDLNYCKLWFVMG
jgi:hypothetical protein